MMLFIGILLEGVSVTCIQSTCCQEVDVIISKGRRQATRKKKRRYFDAVTVFKVTGQLSCSSCLSLLLILIIGSVSLAQIIYRYPVLKIMVCHRLLYFSNPMIYCNDVFINCYIY